MFAKSLRSVRQVSLSYGLLNNIHKNIVPHRESTTLLEYQGLVHRFSNRSTRDCDLFLKTNTFVKHLYNLSRWISLHLPKGSIKMLNYLPFFASGNIVAGFGRGSKELGIPTANYPLEVVKSLPECFKPGVYFGWANIDNGPVYKMVMSIGWNPFYDNKEKSMMVTKAEVKAQAAVMIETKVIVRKIEASVCRMTGETSDEGLAEIAAMLPLRSIKAVDEMEEKLKTPDFSKKMETHILYDFNRELYGCLLKVCIVGYLRPEQNFNSLEELVACIKEDIRQAEDLLESNNTYKQLESHKFFQENSDCNKTK